MHFQLGVYLPFVISLLFFSALHAQLLQLLLQCSVTEGKISGKEPLFNKKKTYLEAISCKINIK